MKPIRDGGGSAGRAQKPERPSSAACVNAASTRAPTASSAPPDSAMTQPPLLPAPSPLSAAVTSTTITAPREDEHLQPSPSQRFPVPDDDRAAAIWRGCQALLRIAERAKQGEQSASGD